ncbi:uncharacterized protein LOC108050282 isoform X2 [Drosophila rhopaloa]|uniref:Uncharacterized protein LOC108050282 isoform X2 n=1 Tax=Drosophila rhopaloa TaxID=1041015 RepID=A0A6P4FQ89_DRORH|nr:uncharacterized protein LOC108050282 isoform X2 [Drosophila rhopaloa]
MSDSLEVGTGENSQRSSARKNTAPNIYLDAEEEEANDNVQEDLQLNSEEDAGEKGFPESEEANDNVQEDLQLDSEEDAGEKGFPESDEGTTPSSSERHNPVTPRATMASNVDSITDSDLRKAFKQLEPKLEESIRSTSKNRRLEYFRSGADADCQVHVLSTCADSEDSEANVCYKKFGCHRIFLATASDKLEQDVYKNKQWNGVLQINGVSPESVEIFLEFIYTFEVTSPLVKLPLVNDIFILSCAYNMPELLISFSEKLKHQEWPLDEIFPALDLAFRHNIMDLERKIMEHAQNLTQEPNLLKLQVYALNYVIQHWMVEELVPMEDLMNIVKQYQETNEITFANTLNFPHFTKIIKYFPNALLDSEGNISRF